MYAILGAAIGCLFAGIGSAVGLQIVGSTGAGVLSEDPDKFGKIFLLTVLPSTQGFYGFIIAIIVIVKIGILGGNVISLTPAEGAQILFSALPVGIVGLISGIHQGKVCAAGVEMAAKQPESAMRPVIYGVMVETYAVLGLVISFLLIMLGVKG